MKKIIALFMIIASVSCTKAQTEFNKESQEYALTNIEGKPEFFKEILDKNQGKTIMIEVWASWCSDCVKAMERVKTIQESNPEVVYVFISMDKNIDKWREGVEKHQLKGKHFWVDDKNGMKGEFGQSIGLDWIPRYIVVDKTGKILIYKAVETDFEKIIETLKSQR